MRSDCPRSSPLADGRCRCPASCGPFVASRLASSYTDDAAMHPLLERMSQLAAAEEFLDFLGVDYDCAIVDVHRLHILKRFRNYLRRSPPRGDATDDEAWQRCRALLTRAYRDFVRSRQ